MAALGDWLDALAHEHAERTALISATERVTFAELARDATRVATGLAALGVAKGTRVGILMPNCARWLACAFGAWKNYGSSGIKASQIKRCLAFGCGTDKREHTTVRRNDDGTRPLAE